MREHRYGLALLMELVGGTRRVAAMQSCVISCYLICMFVRKVHAVMHAFDICINFEQNQCATNFAAVLKSVHRAR